MGRRRTTAGTAAFAAVFLFATVTALAVTGTDADGPDVAGVEGTALGTFVRSAGPAVYLLPLAAVVAAALVYAGVSRARARRARAAARGEGSCRLLADHARALAALYGGFGGRDPAAAAAWKRLAADEEKHARWFEELLALLRAGEVELAVELLPPGRIEAALGRARLAVREGGVPVALALEQLSERESWGLAAAWTKTTARAATILSLLQSETAAHRVVLQGLADSGAAT